MDENQFDRFVRSLSAAGTRRGLLRLLLNLPVAVGLERPLFEGSEARGRHDHTLRQRRVERRDRVHDEKKKRKKKKKKTTPLPCAQIGQTPVSDQSCCTGLVLDGAGQCAQPAPPSCANSCGGCCSGDTCVTATSTAACGASGAPCGVCSGLQGTCFNGACHCDVCASGCRYTTVQAAVADPSGPTTITVCAGNYTGDVAIDRSLTLIGAGEGADPTNNTILNGTGSDSVVTTSASVTVTLQRLRITGGSANQGGGIFIGGGTHTLIECTIIDNHAESGGGIFIAMGNVQMTDCTVLTNTTMVDGGGMYSNGTLTINSTSVVRNNAGGQGGGIVSVNPLTATDLIVSRNAAGIGGGGISNFGAMILQTSSVVRNFGGFSLAGGGILNTGAGTVTLIDSDVGLNTASGATGGGGIQQSGISVTLSGVDNKVLGNSPTNCAPPGAVVGCSG